MKSGMQIIEEALFKCLDPDKEFAYRDNYHVQEVSLDQNEMNYDFIIFNGLTEVKVSISKQQIDKYINETKLED